MVSAPIAGLNVLRAPIVLAISAMPAKELAIANLVSARASTGRAPTKETVLPPVPLAALLKIQMVQLHL